MHQANELFWKRCEQKYYPYFHEPSKVIEFGSRDIGGSIRDFFGCSSYIGIDWRGHDPTVNFVCLAHEVPFVPETFDTVVSASMLEHDPHWKKSLAKMVEVLKPDGVFIISWGSALNHPHHEGMAPDGKFHSLQAGKAIQRLEKLGMYIHEFQYERSILEYERANDPEIDAQLIRNKQAGIGAVVLVAFKDRAYAKGEQIIDPLFDEDRT